MQQILQTLMMSLNVRLCPDEYRRHRPRGRERRRSLLYDWIVSRAMGLLYKTESEYCLGAFCHCLLVFSINSHID